MKCPLCDAPKSRVDLTKKMTHESVEDPVTQRRRTCLTCRKPFYTYEIHSSQWRMVQQLLEIADVCDNVSGLIRTRLMLRKTGKRNGIKETH